MTLVRAVSVLPWGMSSYEATPPNIFYDAQVLMDYFNVAQRDETFGMQRQVDMAVELATHPKVSATDRIKYAQFAMTELDQLVEHDACVLYPKMHLLHALLPAILDSSKSGKKMVAESANRTRQLVAKLEENYYKPNGHNRVGYGSELLTALSFQLLGCSALSSVRRQDQTRIPVDEQPYSWDITTTPLGGPYAQGNYFYSVKTSAYLNWRKYHPDIIKYALFRSKRPAKDFDEPLIFKLLHALTDKKPINHSIEDPLNDHFQRLDHSLRTSRPATSPGMIAVLPFVT